MKFDSYHPIINLIFFGATIWFTVMFNHPIYVSISFITAFLSSVRMNGKNNLIFNVFLLFFVVIYGGFYSYYNHFGVTPIRQNFIGNSITQEALIYGWVLGAVIAAVIMWTCCIIAVFTSDKIVYIAGRISPKLSLFISMILRCAPRIKKEFSVINTSQRGIGKGISDGNIIRKLINVKRIISVLITKTLENFVESASSMNSRGYLLRGRTAFSIYRFDNRDRALVLVMVVLIVIILFAFIFNQTNIYYNPEIIFNRKTALSYFFYFVYTVFLFIPMSTEIKYR